MDEAQSRAVGVLPVAQLVACGIAALLGLAIGVSELFGDGVDTWPMLVLGVVGAVCTVLVWRTPVGRSRGASYLGGLLMPALLLLVLGISLFGVYAVVVLVATLIDLTTVAVARRRRRGYGDARGRSAEQRRVRQVR